jgi:hypothetical protein
MDIPQAIFIAILIGGIVALAVFRWTMALEVVLGLLVVIAIYRMALWIMKKDQLVITKLKDSARPQRVSVVGGYALTASASDRVWTTVMQDAENYAPLVHSLNRKGGAQFTYQFWMFVGDESKSNVAGHTILLRGDAKQYKWEKWMYNTADVQNALALQKNMLKAVNTLAPAKKVRESGVFVKCPLIRFGPTYDSFVVELNTLHDPDVKIVITPNEAKDGIDGTQRANALKLSASKWVLHTFTFEDHVAITDFEDGIVMRYYINDLMYHTARVPSAIRQNLGDLHLLPSGPRGLPLKDCKIGNVAYFNYAITPDEIHKTFRAGPPRKMSTDIVGAEGGRGDPLYLAEYNRLDVYNT